eukprot:TRINITY_DN35033_c0_g1_i1.p1 TRINITY_DN35033_c0_g1~~TRINITY_DN35033_c0_g1_i1.p1  ORF type:complete len:211 (+),score=-22.29 TRINITY_DN35033_c0_g1_i1:249-881(+)
MFQFCTVFISKYTKFQTKITHTISIRVPRKTRFVLIENNPYIINHTTLKTLSYYLLTEFYSLYSKIPISIQVVVGAQILQQIQKKYICSQVLGIFITDKRNVFYVTFLLRGQIQKYTQKTSTQKYVVNTSKFVYITVVGLQTHISLLKEIFLTPHFFNATFSTNWYNKGQYNTAIIQCDKTIFCTIVYRVRFQTKCIYYFQHFQETTNKE